MNLQTKVSAFAIHKFKQRYRRIYGGPAPQSLIRDTLKQIKAATKSKSETKSGPQFTYSLSKTGSVDFFILSDIVFFGLYGKKFLVFSMMFCSPQPSVRKKFYRAICERSQELLKSKDVQDATICCHFDDPISKRYFKTRGKLSQIELVGDVNRTLRQLASPILPHRPLTIRKLKKSDVKTVAEFEFLSHKKDVSSRMNQFTRNRAQAHKMFASFHNMLVKKANAYVSCQGQQITGVAAVFPNENYNVGNIATIAVHPHFQGQGLAQGLYKEILSSLKVQGINKFVGHSTTTTVLRLAKKLRRREFSRTYTMSLKSLARL